MASFFKSRFFRACRRVFRWCRILILLLVLVLVGAGIYLNEVGLPEFMKQRVLARLRQNNIELEFRRMRLRWYRGIVVDDAVIRRPNDPFSPKLTARNAEFDVGLNLAQSSAFNLKSVIVEGAQLTLPIPTNNTTLLVSNVEGRIFFPGGNLLRVEALRGNFRGAAITASGTVTNFGAIAQWPVLAARKTASGARGTGLKQFADVLEKIQIAGQPQLEVRINGDGRSPDSLGGSIDFKLPSAETPWGKFLQANFNARFVAGDPTRRVRLSLEEATTTNGAARKIEIVAALTLREGDSGWRAELEGKGASVHLLWGEAASAGLTATLNLNSNAVEILSGNGIVRLAGVKSKWGDAGTAGGEFKVAPWTPKVATNTTWGLWAGIASLALDWKIDLGQVDSPRLQVEKIFCAGQWRAPELHVTDLQGTLYNGGVKGTGELDVVTRVARLKVTSDFDLHKITHLLTTNGQDFIRQFTWAKPPRIRGDIAATLPVWTNRAPNWRGEVQPTVRINGHFEIEQGSFRGVPALTAKSDFIYTNICWFLSDIHATRPEGDIHLELISNELTHDYQFRIFSRIDPNSIRPLLGTNEARGLDQFKLTGTPEIRGQIQGRWRDRDRTSFAGEVALTNFIFRGEQVDNFKTALAYTNGFVQFRDLRVERGNTFIKTPRVDFDVPERKLYFTNVDSTTDPMAVVRAIGAKTAATIEPYHFDVPPHIRLNGTLVLHETEQADMHFQVEGEKFKWLMFGTEKLSGNIDWVGETVTLTNVQGNGYGGGLAGSAFFNVARARTGSDFNFVLGFSDINLAAFMQGIHPTGTNHLEGILAGQFVVTSGSTRDLKSWQGFGEVHLTDGFLWEIPIFGVFSPVLNAIVPGLGKTKAREAAGHFNMTNSVIYSYDLEIHAATLDMSYRGWVDFDQHVEARVEAEILKSTWLIGPLIRYAFMPFTKIFEYKVNGTLKEPKTEPLHIPKFLMMTLRPFHTLKEMLPVPDKPVAAPLDQPVKTPP